MVWIHRKKMEKREILERIKRDPFDPYAIGSAKAHHISASDISDAIRAGLDSIKKRVTKKNSEYKTQQMLGKGGKLGETEATRRYKETLEQSFRLNEYGHSAGRLDEYVGKIKKIGREERRKFLDFLKQR